MCEACDVVAAKAAERLQTAGLPVADVGYHGNTYYVRFESPTSATQQALAAVAAILNATLSGRSGRTYTYAV